MRLLIFIVTLFFNFAHGNELDSLFKHLNKRLSYMPDVAHYKAQHHLPIENISREQKVSDKAAISAREFGINVQSAIAFNQTQMNIAKIIQYRHRANLLNAVVVNKPKDLNTHVRPALLKLGKDINQAIAIYLKRHGKITEQHWLQFQQTVNHPLLKLAEQRILFDALKSVYLANQLHIARL